MAGIKFGGCVQDCHYKNIGGLVRDRHMYIYVSLKYWRILTTKFNPPPPPNFPSIRYINNVLTHSVRFEIDAWPSDSQVCIVKNVESTLWREEHNELE